MHHGSSPNTPASVQYPYQDTNSHLTNADIGVTSTVGQAPTSNWQVQMQLLRPALATPWLSIPLVSWFTGFLYFVLYFDP
jgi:hypothetical protein